MRIRLAALPIVVALVLSACGSDSGGGGNAAGDLESIDGVVVEAVTGADHIQGDLDYPDSPPSGGDHNPVWQNCDFYEAPIFDETAVHAMEHGVVWLAYSPDLSADEVATVRELFESGDGRTIASPHPDVDVLEAVAWKHRLVVDDVNDPRVSQFIEAASSGAHSPEPGAACQEGFDDVSETGKP
jgi:hypothetical protein